MVSLSGFICVCLCALNLGICFSCLISRNNKLKSYFIILMLWFYANYFIFWIFGLNETWGILYEAVIIVKFYENFFLTKFIVQLFYFCNYSQINYNLSLVAPIILWFGPMLTLESKLKKISLCIIWNAAYIYQATLDENSYYGILLPSIYPIAYLMIYHYYLYPQIQIFPSEIRSNIEDYHALIIFCLTAIWFLLIAKWFDWNPLEIWIWIFWFFMDCIVAYFAFTIYICVFGELINDCNNNFLIVKSKIKDISRINNSAAAVLLDCFWMILVTLIWCVLYIELAYYLSFPWIITEGFIGTLVFAFTLCFSFPIINDKDKDQNILLNFFGCYLSACIARAILL